LPLAATFDFAAYMKRPADVAAPDDFDLGDINKENCAREKHNKESLQLTRAYVAAASSAAGARNLDVGYPLRPSYAYSVEDKELLVSSDSAEKATGPLPLHFLLEIERERTKRKNLAETARNQREQERAAKDAVSSRPALGTMVMTDPRPISATISGSPPIPELWLTSLQHKVFFPLNFWLDKTLRQANDFPHSFAVTSLSNASGVAVLNVNKALSELGDEDVSNMTPGLWRYASINLLSAWKKLCPDTPRTDPGFQPTPASEYEQHVAFFANQDIFEDLEYFSIWSHLEHSLRYEIFRNHTFDINHYQMRLQVSLAAYRQARDG
ncbi:hypothetical protein R3P38DRAFT_2572145, partial [Favolaschia claudopus]